MKETPECRAGTMYITEWGYNPFPLKTATTTRTNFNHTLAMPQLEGEFKANAEIS